MKTAFVAAILSIVSIQAFAAGKTTIEITVNQALDARNALSALDAYQDTDSAGKQVTKKYKFSVPARVAMAQDLWALNLVYTAAMAQRNALISDAQLKPNAPIPATLTANINKIGDQKQSLEIVALSEDDLDLSANPIPPATLAALTPLMADSLSAVSNSPLPKKATHPSDD